MKTKNILIISMILIIIVLVIDKLIVAKYVNWLHQLVGIKPLILIGVDFKIPYKIGGVSTLLMMYIIIFFIFLPWTDMFDRNKWKDAFKRWYYIATALLALPLGLIIGGILYKLIKSIFPESLNSLLESFGIGGTFFIYENDIFTIEATALSLIGLAFGIYFYFKRIRNVNNIYSDFVNSIIQRSRK
jgi:hypothetical protein